VPLLDELYATIDQFQDAEALIGRLLNAVAATPHKIYLLIDEYDHNLFRPVGSPGGTGGLRFV
jgi:hypothetical protein